jgi:phosphoserine aminotransferase
MNMTFRTPSPKLDDLFIAEALKHGMDQIKGHRATGGMRASMYNAFPREGAEALAQFMREFERTHG